MNFRDFLCSFQLSDVLLPKSFLSTSLSVFLRKKVLQIRDMHSAMGKHHQTLSILPVRLSRYAAGSRAISWRIQLVMSEKKLLSSAWQAEPAMMQKLAIGKWKAMRRSAGMPMASISSEGEKILSSSPGMHSKMMKPATMNTAA